MKHNFLLLCILFFCMISVNAQNEKSPENINFNNYSYLSINPLSNINLYIPRLRIGYIQNINDSWKAGLDLGFGNNATSFFDINLGENYRIWEVRPELYYFTRSQKTYISTEIFYINHKDVFMDEFYSPSDDESTNYDQANYQREKYGINFKYGFLFNSKRKITFNLYTGLGLRIRKNTFSNIQNPKEIDVGPEGGDMFGLETYKRIEGTNFAPNFVLGFKILFRLNN